MRSQKKFWSCSSIRWFMAIMTVLLSTKARPWSDSFKSLDSWKSDGGWERSSKPHSCTATMASWEVCAGTLSLWNSIECVPYFYAFLWLIHAFFGQIQRNIHLRHSWHANSSQPSELNHLKIQTPWPCGQCLSKLDHCRWGWVLPLQVRLGASTAYSCRFISGFISMVTYRRRNLTGSAKYRSRLRLKSACGYA